MEKKSVALALVLCISPCLWMKDVYAAPLSSYQVSAFSSPDPSLQFNQIAVYNVTGDVYVGARERLYQLRPDLTLYQTEIVGSCKDVYSRDNKENDNKLLVIAPSPVEKLITCGSCDGYCETRSLINISSVTRHEEDVTQKVVITSDVPTVGIVTLGSDRAPQGSGTENGNLYLFTGRSYSADEHDRMISKHFLTYQSWNRGILYSEQYTEIYESNLDLQKNSFVQVISHEDYIYYFIQRENVTQRSFHAGKVCPNSFDNHLDSYTEIELRCRGSNFAFDSVKAVHVGPAGSKLAESLGINSVDDVLYVLFATDATSFSAGLCMYRMSDIQLSFNYAVGGCVQGDSSLGTPIEYLHGSGCGKVSKKKK